MPLKILLADDSMTAQKMGKEILTGAGYEVIAVSNGAAAAKKLAEKPDIAILDIIMPGYTGLEVCERIRGAIDSAKMPVLLTVGKMEHFDQKEVQRVAADGVIIKPFEASDLLATVQKFVEKLSAPKAAAAAASREKTLAFTSPNVEEFKDDSYNQWKTEAEVHDETTGEMPASKKTFDIPAEAAAAPMFLEEEPAAAPAPAVASGTSRDKTVLITPPNFPMNAASAAAAAPAFETTPVEAPAAPAFEMSAAPAMEFSPAPPAFEDTAQFAPAPAISAAPAHGQEKPAIEFTAHAPVEVNPPIVSGFEATAHAAVDVAHSQDPALATGTEGFDSFTTKVGTEEPTPAPAPTADDFEARVAAAMSGYGDAGTEVVEESPTVEAVPEPEPEYLRTQKITAVQDIERPAEIEAAPEPITQGIETPAAHTTQIIETQVMEVPVPPIGEEPAADATAVPEGMMDAALVEQMQAAVSDMPVAAAPSEDTQAMEVPVAATPSEAAPTVEVAHQDIELAKALAAAVGGEIPSTAASGPSDHPQEVHEIAHTVTQVFNRMLPDIMEEVKKELARRQKK